MGVAITIFGLDDQLIFPELNYDDVQRQQGLDITIVTTAKTDEEAEALLELLGMPLARPRARPNQRLRRVRVG